MPARGALTLFHVRGIRIAVDYSWFFVLFLLIIYLSGFYEEVTGPDASEATPYALAVVSAVAFFGSIVLHELGHAFVALRNGIGIREITLWLFGGVAHMNRDTDSAKTEFKVAIAGPLVTLFIAIACVSAGVAFAGSEQGFLDAMLIKEGAEVPGGLAALGFIASMNLLVLVFNMIPAFPLDGGRVARAIAWRITGDRTRATRFAAGVGQGFSYLFMALGFALIIGGGDAIFGIWLALIGFILGNAARGAARQTEITSKLDEISVADVMDDEPVAIPDDTTIERAFDEFFLRYQWPWFPVTDATQRFRGLIVREVAEAVPDADRATRRVADVLEADETRSLQVRDDAPIESLLGSDALRRLGALAAVDSDGRLRGIVTAEQLGRALRDALVESTEPGPSNT